MLTTTQAFVDAAKITLPESRAASVVRQSLAAYFRCILRQVQGIVEAADNEYLKTELRADHRTSLLEIRRNIDAFPDEEYWAVKNRLGEGFSQETPFLKLKATPLGDKSGIGIFVADAEGTFPCDLEHCREPPLVQLKYGKSTLPQGDLNKLFTFVGEKASPHIRLHKAIPPAAQQLG